MRQDERTRLVQRLSRHAPIESGYNVASCGNHHPDVSHAWCFEHANMVAHAEAIMVGAPMYAVRLWCDYDSVSHCEWYRCGIALRPDGGGLTTEGVDSALGITEEKVLEAHIYPAELVLSWTVMSTDDPRWELWDWHTCRLLGLPLPEIEVHVGCHGVVLLNKDRGSRCTRCHRECPTHTGVIASCFSCIAGRVSMDQRACKEDCFKVVHRDGTVERVYVVTAFDRRMAKEVVRDQVRHDHTCDKTCGWSIALFRPEAYFLYAINMADGNMTPVDSTGSRLCFVCLGNVAS